MKGAVRAFTAVFLFALLTVGLHYGLFSLLNASGAMALKDIRVVSNRAVRTDDIINASGLARGQDIFRIDLALTAGMVSRHPLIKTAVVKRLPPSGIEIEVAERMPVAYVAGGTNTLLCDSGGGVLKGWQAAGIPGIAVPYSLIVENGRVTDGFVRNILLSLSEYPESRRIRNITLRQGEGCYMLLNGLDTLFFLGAKVPTAVEFEKAVRIGDRIVQDKLSVRYVDIEKDNAVGYK